MKYAMPVYDIRPKFVIANVFTWFDSQRVNHKIVNV